MPFSFWFPQSPFFLWIQKAKGAPVLGYNIQYFAENSTNLTEINNVTNQRYELLLMDQTYRVSVTSFNYLGKSQEAVLRIPAAHEESKYPLSSIWLKKEQSVPSG